MKRFIPFIFVNTTANPENRAAIETDDLTVVTVGARNYAEAGKLAKEFADKGAVAIELCSAFGPKGTAIVVDAVENKIPVGVVRFDRHPGVSRESGDTKFL